eukprot:CAMPEP_0116024646 /NCGR_PEP_ID=MMETSP0321-20121206/12459_1 /TAXON_ID=163516 /ORGANISM="Leptocylindrus danicus var. danicus, Strain B650" /LENGTH=588 /DNA_ID=CAMNT_0003496453 /DNA_START=308 /DNA_END=2074 /DNA_ORIENTATION=+
MTTADYSSKSVADWGLELILRWIKDAGTRCDRVSGLDAAIEAFDHNDEAEHDRELRTGIAELLSGVIVLALSPDDDGDGTFISTTAAPPLDDTAGGDAEDDTTVEEEIAKTLSALEMIHRCSTKALQQSFDTIGSELLPLLLEVIEIALPVIHENDWWFLACCNAIKIIAYFASLGNGHTSMGGHRAYLSTLMSILLCESTSQDDEINDLISEVLNILSTYPRKRKLSRVYGLCVAVYSAALNENSSDEVRESAAFFIMSMLESEDNRVSMMRDESGPLLEFLTKSMMDTRINNEQVNWTRCSAAKAAHMLCIPEANAATLSSYDDGAFVEALVKMVLDGSESFSAACGLCYLVGYTDSTRDDLTQTRPALLDVLAKTALTNPNATMAAEAVFKLLPVSSHDLFRRIALLLTLQPNSFCENTAVTAILERIGYSPEMRMTLADDECIVMILVKAARNATQPNLQSQATKALHLLSIDSASREKLLEDPDIVLSLALVVKGTKLGTSSKSSGYMFHEASADATCALCNLVIDDESNDEVYTALEPPKKVLPRKNKGLWICRCRRKACRQVENVFFSLCSDATSANKVKK